MDRDDGFDDELHYSDEFVSYGSFDDEDEDDPAYDVNRERDKGDSEDVDVEAHEKQHESLRNNAILDIGVGIQQHMSTEISSNTGGNRNRISHKGRGPTKAFRVKEPMYLKFDHLLRPTGRWRHKYGQFVGFSMRKVNINWGWKIVSKGLKDAWYCSMHKKDKRTGVRSIPSEKTKSVATKYLEFKDKEIQGTFKPNKNKDALYMAFGEKLDRPGRAFGYGGVNIGIRKAFGYNPKIVSESGLHGRDTTFEDQEALKAQIRDELRAEFNATLKEKLTSILHDMGITSLRMLNDPSTPPHIVNSNHSNSSSAQFMVNNEVNKENDEMSRIEPSTKDSTSQRSPMCVELLVPFLSVECQWLLTNVKELPTGQTVDVLFEASIFRYTDDRTIRVNKKDIKQFLESKKLNISIIMVFVRSLVDDILSFNFISKIGWLCPECTSDTRINISLNEVKDYVFRVFEESVKARENFILAPIIENDHWILLAISVTKGIVYHFDSISLTGRMLKMKLIINSQLRRYKISGGEMHRDKPMWKDMKCAQQPGIVECGFYIMKYMQYIISNCISIDDIDKINNAPRLEAYTNYEIDEVRNKWAKYLTDYYM